MQRSVQEEYRGRRDQLGVSIRQGAAEAPVSRGPRINSGRGDLWADRPSGQVWGWGLEEAANDLSFHTGVQAGSEEAEAR